MKVAIITNGAFPVPATKGGAVEALVEELLAENEMYAKADITLFSIYDEAAVNKSKEYKKTTFKFIDPSHISKGVDGFFHFIAYNIFHSKRHLAFKTTFQRINYLYIVAKMINEEDYDKIVVENQLASLWVLKYKNNMKKYKNKVYFHLHNHPAKYANAKDLLLSCNKVIAVSEFIGKAFAKNIGIEYSENKFTVLKNMVDEKLFDPSKISETQTNEIKKKLNIHDEKVILFLGRLIPGKGVAELMQAFNQIDNENVKLVIVGSFNFNSSEHSTYEDKLEQIMNEIGKDKIIFTGFINHDEVPLYYSIADIVVLPSTCEDAAPLTMSETILMHKPLITTTKGGIPEYATDKCAIKLENGEHLVHNLKNAMSELLNDEKKREEMAFNCYEESKSWKRETFYNNFISLLEE